MGVLVPPPIGVDSTLIGVKSSQKVPEEFGTSVQNLNLTYDWQLPRKGARDKALVRGVDLRESEVQLTSLDTGLLCNVESLLAGYPVHLILSSWGPKLPVADAEKVDAVASRDETLGV